MNPLLRAARVCLIALGALFVCSPLARTQQIDLAVGAGTLWGTRASQSDSGHSPVSLSGGSYFSASGDVLLHKRLGVQAEVAWKGDRGIYYAGGYNQHYRPFFYDVNAIWVAKRHGRLAPELMAGVGAQNTRFYKGTTGCTFTACTNFVSSNHFMGHIGGGLKLYAFHNIFIRPEGHLYLVHNDVEFSSDHVVRYGVSLGYTF